MNFFQTMLLMITVCSSYGQTVSVVSEKYTVEIFLVEKGSIDTSFGCRYCFWPAAEDLADTAFIKDSEIIAYEISNDNLHYIILSEEAIQRLRIFGRTPPPLSSSSSYPFYFTNRSFAMVVNGKPVYGGWFRNQFLSSPVDWIIISTPFDKEWDGKLRIYLGTTPNSSPEQFGDPRNHEQLMESLIKTKRLKKF